MLQVMFVSHVFAQLVPSLIISTDPANSAAKTYVVYCVIVTVLIPFGGMLADGVLGVRSRTSFYRVPVDDSLASRRRFARFFVAYLALCAIIFVSYVIQVPAIPIYDLVLGLSDAAEHQLARREVSTLGYIYGVALRFFMPVLFVIGLLSLSRSYFSNRFLRWAGVLAILISFSYNAWPGSKTPVATLFLLATFVLLIRSSEEVGSNAPGLYVQTMKQQRRRRKRAFRLAVGLFLFVVLYPVVIFLFLPAGQLGIGYILESVFLRIFFKPAENSYMAFELFRYGNFTYFSDVRAVASLFDLPYVSLSQEVALAHGRGEFTNAPPAAVANFYAQGGGIFVVLGVTLASALFKLTENFIRHAATKTPLTVALYAILIFAAFRFSWANFHSMVMSEVFLPMACLWVFWSILGYRKNRAH